MTFRTTFAWSTPHGLETKLGHIRFEGSDVSFRADGETIWYPMMNTSGWSEESIDLLMKTFAMAELKILQNDMKDIARIANDMLKSLGSKKRVTFDYDDFGDICDIRLVTLKNGV